MDGLASEETKPLKSLALTTGDGETKRVTGKRHELKASQAYTPEFGRGLHECWLQNIGAVTVQMVINNGKAERLALDWGRILGPMGSEDSWPDAHLEGVVQILESL